jgi:ribose transport system substrate-binding protein
VIRLTRRLALSLTAAMLLPFAAGQPARAEDPTIGLITTNQQALFFNQVSAGAKEAAKKDGLNLVIYDPNNDPAKQNDAVDAYIEQKVKGLIILAIDVNGIMPAVKKAAAAGIPVISVDSVLPPGPQKTQIGVDSPAGGAAIAHLLVDDVNAHMGGKAKVGIVGALNSFIQNLRQKGFEDVLKTAPGIQVIQVVDGRNVQDNAMSVAETLMTANPDLDAIYATGEPALIGAIRAVESQGKTDKVKIVGWDLSPAAIKGLDGGYVIGVVQQDPSLMGAAGVDALSTLIKGGTIPDHINTKLTIVTKANLDPYRAMFK